MFNKPKEPESAPQPLATYPIDDYAALDGEQVAALVARAEADLANQVAGCAHLVVTRDLGSGQVQHHVPCTSGKEALALAAHVLADKRAEDPDGAFTITVTPLLPH